MQPNGGRTPRPYSLASTSSPAARPHRPPLQHGLRSHRPRHRSLPWPQLWLALLLLLTACWTVASAPRHEQPAAAERFADWAQARNQSLIQTLPGALPASAYTPPERQPPATASAAIAAAPEQAPPPPTAEPTAAPAYPVYADGDLEHHSDTLDISVTQHTEGKFTYYLADIQVRDASQFWYAFSSDKFGGGNEAASDIAHRNGAALAFNGDFYGHDNVGITIRGGEFFRAKNSARHLLIVDGNGDLSALTDRREKQGVVADRLVDEGVLHTFEFGPLLVKDGQAAKLPAEDRFFIRTGNGYREPRTAIGQVGPLHYIVIVVDGRTPGYSEGCDLPALQQLFLKHGASFAFNLDGGGSTTLYFGGRVINHPASGSERSVSDIIMFID